MSTPPNTPAPDCGITTIYGIAALGTSDPRAICGAYAGQLFTLRSSTANWDPCTCTAVAPSVCSGGSAWVEGETNPDFPTACAPKPRFATVAKITNTKAALGGRFGRLAIYDDLASAPNKYVDKGTDWGVRLLDGAFSSETNGCVIGQGYTIKHTADGGVHWVDAQTSWSCPPNLKFGNGIDFSVSGDAAVAVGDSAFLAHSAVFLPTTGGPLPPGAVWFQSSPPTGVTGRLNVVAFARGSAPDNQVWAVGDAGLVLRSDDDGASWITRPIPGSGPNLLGVSISGSGAYVVGDDQSAFFSNDGGSSWTAVPVNGGSSTEDFLDVVTWGDGSQAIAVGSEGGVYEKTSTRFAKLTIPSTIAVTTPLYDVEVVGNSTTVRICGDLGIVLFRDSGTWTRPWAQTNMSLYRMSFQSANHCFGIGRGSVVVEYE